MTIRNHEDIFSISENSSQYITNLDLSLSQGVEHWRHLVDQGYPLTPPDTASESASSDILDMDCLPWAQGAQFEDTWYQDKELNNVNQISMCSDWPDESEPSAGAISISQDYTPWTSHVEEGMSPALSFISKSGHTFNTVSEAESLSQIPSSGSPYPALIIGEDNAHRGQKQQPLLDELSIGSSSMPNVTFYDLSQPMSRTQTTSLPVRRPFEPAQQHPLNATMHHGRTHGPSFPGPPMAANMTTPPVRSNASTSICQYRRNDARLDCSSMPEPADVPAFVHMDRSISLSSRQPSGIVDPVAEDFTTFIDLCPEDVNSNNGSRTGTFYPAQAMLVPAQWSDHLDAMSGDTYTMDQIASVQALEHHSARATRRISGLTVNTHNEAEEGRHRTDPLYNQDPAADGLYHCPYSGTENCNHSPTKLKCNYDKFIDSHLKPFRCKVEACSTQVFSSTACLLRHEREAHGMYGHGKWSCEFAGCERSDPDKGFPRLYNLRDHMKRVHAWKEPVNESSDPERRRKTGGRKRKISTSKTSPAPTMQRQRTDRGVPQAAVPIAEHLPVLRGHMTESLHMTPMSLHAQPDLDQGFWLSTQQHSGPRQTDKHSQFVFRGPASDPNLRYER